MASLEIRNGVWQIRYRDKRGKSRRQSTELHTSPKNDALAQKKLQAFEVDQRRGHEPGGTMLIEALLDDVLRYYAVNKLKDELRAKLRIEKHLRPWFGEMRADRLGADDIREYQDSRRSTVDNSTINREIGLLHRGYTLALESGRLTTIPHFPKLKEAKPLPGFLERHEVERLCHHLPEWLRPVVWFGFWTGWRIGEIRALEWRQVHFEAGEIQLDDSKNGDGRVFPMTAELRGLLESVKPASASRNPAIFPTTGVGGAIVSTLTNLVFTRRLKSGARLPLGDFDKRWAMGLHKAGLPCTVEMEGKRIKKIVPGLVFHCLRASAIIDMDRRGIRQKVIMALTGHRTVEMHLRYRKVSTRDLDLARKALEA